MTHQPSAYEIKTGKRHISSRDFPKKGTKLYKFADFLLNNPGTWNSIYTGVFFKTPSDIKTAITQLNLSYGLDIRYQSEKWGSGKTKVILAGELIGKIYIDYIKNPELAKRLDK